MPTNLAIDDKLLAQALKIGGFRTKRETVNTALAELIAQRKRLKLIDLFGTIEFREDWDYKADRQRKPKRAKRRP